MKEQKKLKKINSKINRHEMIERINIKEIVPEILDETKASEEIKTNRNNNRDNNNEKKTTIMKRRLWKKIDEQETLQRQA